MLRSHTAYSRCLVSQQPLDRIWRKAATSSVGALIAEYVAAVQWLLALELDEQLRAANIVSPSYRERQIVL